MFKQEIARDSSSKDLRSDNPTLLVVEDDEMSRRAWNSIFSRRGWDVTAVGTVAEALALLDPAPDFLILDLSLADGDGEAILSKVRDAHLKTRVAVTTGTCDVARLRDVEGLNPEALLEKPISVVDLWFEGELTRTG
jgi:ActR/RegA family two-component response regulator